MTDKYVVHVDPSRYEAEDTPDFDMLMAFFEPRFREFPWEPGEPPPVSARVHEDILRRTISSRFATQSMEVISDATRERVQTGHDADDQASPASVEAGDPTGG